MKRAVGTLPFCELRALGVHDRVCRVAIKSSSSQGSIPYFGKDYPEIRSAQYISRKGILTRLTLRSWQDPYCLYVP